MARKELRHEPDRGSQICGYQLSENTWTSRAAYCGEPKAKDLYFCREHHDWVALDEPDGIIRMAPGNAIGTGKG